MNLTKWSEKIHANAKDKGWWDEERSVDDIIALCHSELSEALEHYRDGHTVDEVFWVCTSCGASEATRGQDGDCWCAGTRAKPDGVPIEIADCVIRVLDWAGKEGWELEPEECLSAGLPLSTAILDIAEALVDARNHRCNGDYCLLQDALGWAVHSAASYLASIGHDLETLIELKHAYNVTRPHRHGGKVL